MIRMHHRRQAAENWRPVGGEFPSCLGKTDRNRSLATSWPVKSSTLHAVKIHAVWLLYTSMFGESILSSQLLHYSDSEVHKPCKSSAVEVAQTERKAFSCRKWNLFHGSFFFLIFFFFSSWIDGTLSLNFSVPISKLISFSPSTYNTVPLTIDPTLIDISTQCSISWPLPRPVSLFLKVGR